MVFPKKNQGFPGFPWISPWISHIFPYISPGFSYDSPVTIPGHLRGHGCSPAPWVSPPWNGAVWRPAPRTPGKFDWKCPPGETDIWYLWYIMFLNTGEIFLKNTEHLEIILNRKQINIDRNYDIRHKLVKMTKRIHFRLSEAVWTLKISTALDAVPWDAPASHPGKGSSWAQRAFLGKWKVCVWGRRGSLSLLHFHFLDSQPINQHIYMDHLSQTHTHIHGEREREWGYKFDTHTHGPL